MQNRESGKTAPPGRRGREAAAGRSDQPTRDNGLVRLTTTRQDDGTHLYTFSPGRSIGMRPVDGSKGGMFSTTGAEALARSVNRAKLDGLRQVDGNVTTTDPFAMVELWTELENDQAVLLNQELHATLEDTDTMAQAVIEFLAAPAGDCASGAETNILDLLQVAHASIRDVTSNIARIGRQARAEPS